MTLAPYPRVALLLDSIDSDYQVEIIRGALRATKTTNARTLIAPGGWLGMDGNPREKNFLFDFIHRAQVDGLLLVSGSLSNHCGVAQMKNWLKRFEAIPMVSIGLNLVDIPSVTVNNHSGLYTIVSHLIEVHGHKRIGCFRGPLNNLDAQERFAAYEKALLDHGLTVDPRFVCAGDTFGREDGRLCVDQLFHQNRFDIRELDSIACVNDDTALGAMEALCLRGFKLPDDLAIVGFDDAPNARAGNPPLTTVNQRVQEQGFVAAQALLRAIASDSPAQGVQLDPSVVIRGSCGCTEAMSNDSRSQKVVSSGKLPSPALELLGRRQAWGAELARAASGRLTNQDGWEQKILRGVGDEMEGQEGALLYALEKVGRRAIANGGNIDACNDVLTKLRLLLISIVASTSDIRSRLDDVLQETRLRLTNVALGAYREREQASGVHFRNLTRACLNTLLTHDGIPLTRMLREHLPPLGIEACTISRLQGTLEENPTLEVVARLSLDMAQQHSTMLELRTLGLDQNLEHRTVVVLEPLVFDGIPVGLAAMSWGALNPLDYEHLRELFGIAAFGCGGGLSKSPLSVGRMPFLARTGRAP